MFNRPKFSDVPESYMCYFQRKRVDFETVEFGNIRLIGEILPIETAKPLPLSFVIHHHSDIIIRNDGTIIKDRYRFFKNMWHLDEVFKTKPECVEQKWMQLG